MHYKRQPIQKAKNFIEQIAIERMYRLFELAEEEIEQHSERSKRYVEIARKISSRNKVKIPSELQKQYCKKCGSYLKIGKNCSIRVNGKQLNIMCGNCKKTRKMRMK